MRPPSAGPPRDAARSSVAAPEASEDHFRAVFQQAAIGMATISADGGWMAVNPALGDLLGYTSEELLARRFLTLLHPDDRDADSAHFRDMLASGTDRFRVERRFLHRDGHVVWVALSIAIIRDAGGGAVCTLAQMQDVTDRMHVETLLQESEERHRQLVEYSPDGILVFAEGVCRYANAAIATMLGYASPSEVVGRPVLSHVHPSSQPLARARIEALSSGALPERSEFLLMTRAGRVIDVEALGVPTTFQGRPSIQLVVRDTTERKRAEQEIREREAMLRGAFDDAPVGMSLIAFDGRWIRVNQSFCDIIGYTETELLATTFQSLTYPDDLARTLDYHRELLAGRRARYQYEKRYVHRLGHPVWVSVAVAMIGDEAGQAHHLLAQIQDITERKQAEDAARLQVETLQDQLRQAQSLEAIGRLGGAAAPEPEAPRGTERILVVEDEAPFRTVVRRVLERLGYRVIEASSGAEALGVIDAAQERIDLVLTDVVMPDVDGRLLGECMGTGALAPRVVYMSGYSDPRVLRGDAAGVRPAFLQKPFSRDVLARTLRDVLDDAAPDAR